MAKKEPVEQAMDEMEQFEKEFNDTSHELDVEEPVATDEDQPEPDATGDEGEDTELKTADQPSEEGAEEPTAGGAEQDGEPPVEAVTYAIPNDPKMWGKLAGKKVTEEEFLKSGLVSKLLTRDHQELYHMTKYQEEVPALRKKLEEMEKRLSGEQQPDPTQKQTQELTPEKVNAFGQQLEQQFLPQIEKFAEMGGIEEDLAKDYPRFLSTLEFRLQSGQKVIDVLTQGFSALAADWMERNQAEQSNEARTILEGSMIEVAKNQGFDGLSEPTLREEFGDWLADNPAYSTRQVTQMKDDVLGIAFLEFMKHKGGEPAPSPAPAPRNREAMLATGGGRGGAGSGGSGSSPTTEIDDFIAKWQQAQEEAY